MNIKKIVEAFHPVQKLMLEGEAYYRGDNVAIMERRKSFYDTIRGRLQDDFTKANFKLPSGFTKMIVDQKVNYSINKDMVIDAEGLDDLISLKKYKRSLKQIGKQASNKMYGIMQWYTDEAGDLKFKVMPSEQYIIIYNEDDHDIIEKVIRIYKEDKDQYAVVYDADEVAKFKLEDGEYKLVEEPQPNFILRGVNQEDKVVSWGRPPFSVLYNNEEHQNDLARFKPHVDQYDFVQSDLCNNLEDFNDAYWLLKDFNGQDPEQFVEAFKKSRVAMVSGEGGMEQVVRETPYQSREATLKILKHDIFKFAQAVDPEEVQGDVTNVAIESMYSMLDLKANDFEMEIDDFVNESMYFVNRYAELTNKTPVDTVEIKFDRSMIMNKDRMIELSNQSIGSVSNQTRWEHDPRVQNPEEEKERIDAEQGVVLE